MRPHCVKCEKMKDSFILYTAHYSAIKNMTREQKGELLDALFAYAEDETEPTTADAFVQMAFAFMRSSLDKNREKYETKQNRMKELAERRWSKRVGKETVAETADSETAGKEATETADGRCAADATAMRGMRTQCDRNAKKTHAMLNDNVNVNVNATNINVSSNSNYKEISDDISMSNSENPNVDGEDEGALSEEGQAARTSTRSLRLDYNAVMRYWNGEADRTKSPMRHITRMTEPRKGALRARVKENGGDVAVVYKAIDMAMASGRMNGGNKDGWIANYDWMMSPKNFQRVLEGTYTEGGRQQRPTVEPTPPPQEKTPQEVERELERRERQQAEERQRQRERTVERMRGYMQGALKSPRGTMAKIVSTAVKTGQLAELGLLDEWRDMNERQRHKTEQNENE